MSKMLQEAIVDAEALKEAALRNAEQAIIEKYEAEIKDAVTTLLEQPEDEMMGMEPGMEADETVADQLAMAATDGEDLCPCPDEEDTVEIDLDQLVAAAAAEEEAEEVAATGMGLAGDLALEEEIDLDEDLLSGLIEELTVDVEPVPTGNIGATEAQIDDAVEKTIAQAQDTEVAEENEELKKSVEELQEQVEMYVTRIKTLKEQENKIKKVALKMREHVKNVNLQNARLLYTNQVLISDSLNERQKNKIVEAITKAGSVNEAKTIFETLQGAVGTSKARTHKSLSEVVERRSSTLPRASKPKAKSFDPAAERMKLLAGIVNK